MSMLQADWQAGASRVALNAAVDAAIAFVASVTVTVGVPLNICSYMLRVQPH